MPRSWPSPASFGLYCANAGAPFAVTVGITREPRQPIPGPNHQVRTSSRPLSHMSNGGIDWIASSRISESKASMSYCSNALTYRASRSASASSTEGDVPVALILLLVEGGPGSL